MQGLKSQEPELRVNEEQDRQGVSACIDRVGEGRRTNIRERLFDLLDCW